MAHDGLQWTTNLTLNLTLTVTLSLTLTCCSLLYSVVAHCSLLRSVVVNSNTGFEAVSGVLTPRECE